MKLGSLETESSQLCSDSEKREFIINHNEETFHDEESQSRRQWQPQPHPQSITITKTDVARNQESSNESCVVVKENPVRILPLGKRIHQKDNVDDNIIVVPAPPDALESDFYNQTMEELAQAFTAAHSVKQRLSATLKELEEKYSSWPHQTVWLSLYRTEVQKEQRTIEERQKEFLSYRRLSLETMLRVAKPHVYPYTGLETTNLRGLLGKGYVAFPVEDDDDDDSFGSKKIEYKFKGFVVQGHPCFHGHLFLGEEWKAKGLVKELESFREEYPLLQFCCGDIFFDNFVSLTLAEASHHQMNYGTPEVVRAAFVKFPFIFRETPKVMVAFNKLDVCNQINCRVNANILGVTKEGFAVECKTWWDTKLFGVSIAWVAGSPHFVDVGVLSFDFQTSKRATFTEPVRSHVLAQNNTNTAMCYGAAISKLDFGISANLRFEVSMNSPEKSIFQSFEVTAKTWDDSEAYVNNASWFMFHNPNIQSGRVVIDCGSCQDSIEKIIQFDLPFVREPQAVAMFSSLDTDKRSNIRVYAKIRNVTKYDLTLKVGKWSDTRLYPITVTWIAGIQA